MSELRAYAPTVGGLPATGVMICAAGQTIGSITTGSSKVKVAT